MFFGSIARRRRAAFPSAVGAARREGDRGRHDATPDPSMDRASKLRATTVLVVPRSIPTVFCLRTDIGRPELWGLTLREVHGGGSGL